MAGKGWIRLHRKIMDNPIFNDMQLYRLWSICLLEASYAEHYQPIGRQTVLVQPGQFVTGRFELETTYNRGLKRKEKVSDSTVWRWMKKLETDGFLTIEANNKFSVITVDNWAFYQGEDEQNEQQFEHQNEQLVNSKRTSNEQLVNTNNKGNKGNKGDKGEKRDIKDFSAEIENFRSRYSPEHLKLVDEYLDFIRETRTTRRISDSIIHKIMAYFDKYSFVRVEYAIRTHMNMTEKKSAQEAYTFGIVRKTTEQEAAKKLPALREQVMNQNGGIKQPGNRLTPEQLRQLEEGDDSP
ncbi:hypothetical protein [Paenibacillus sp. F4]|uniref:hypothetical protein n=1 Tax=Paenibacillus sp. F4 TaxID=357385 RepID=UPI000C9EF8F8|nr:hypothetical protein [Paenibacillus sp. F4]PNQ78896.1 hypothetical protein C1T21_22890 [Paenibacillus sp. F4]